MSMCVVPLCKRYGKSHDVSYFKFPQNATRRLIWTVLVRKWKKMPTWKPDDKSRICSDHFSPKCIIINGHKRRLEKYAVPYMVADEAEYGDDEDDLLEWDESDQESCEKISHVSDVSSDVKLLTDTDLSVGCNSDVEDIEIVADTETQEKADVETDVTIANGPEKKDDNFKGIEVEPNQPTKASDIKGPDHDAEKEKIRKPGVCGTENVSREQEACATEEKSPEPEACAIEEEIVDKQISQIDVDHEEVIDTEIEKFCEQGKQTEVKKTERRKCNEVEKFKRRIIRAVARQINENDSEEEMTRMWHDMKRDSKCDCKLLWERMRTLTLKKIKRLLPAEDRTDNITNIARLTATDWLLFDLVLVHEKIDVIGQDLWSKSGEEPEVLYDLFYLVRKHNIEELIGTNLIDGWLKLTREYNDGDRKCSPMMLQRRWFQMKALTRERFYKFWGVFRGQSAHYERAQQHKPTELQADIVRKYRNIVTTSFLDWPDLIAEGKVILAQEFDDRITEKRKGPVRDVEPDLVVIEQNVETIDVESDSESNIEEDKEEISEMDTDIAKHIKKEEFPIDIDEMDSLKLLESINIPCETPFAQSEEPFVANLKSNVNMAPQILNVSDYFNKNEASIEAETACTYKKESDNTDFCKEKNGESHKIILTHTVAETPGLNGSDNNINTKIEINESSEMIVDNEEEVSIVSDNLPNPNAEIKPDLNETDTALPKITQVTSFVTPSTTEKVEEPLTLQYNKNCAENLNLSIPSHIQNKVSKIIMEKLQSDNEILGNIELPSGIQFADDGIMLDEEDEEVKDSGSVSVKDDNEVDEEEMRDEAECGKIDLKLLLCPTVYTKKLEHMDVFKFLDFNHIRDKRVIECAVIESKPLRHKPVNVKEIVSQNFNEEVDNDEGMNLLELRNTVSWSSWLLKKPRVSNYNPIQLCKNPDFNTRLKRLTAGFFTYERNRRLLKTCKPLTIDLHKSFEAKLVNDTLRLKDVHVTNASKQQKSQDLQVKTEPEATTCHDILQPLNPPFAIASSSKGFVNISNTGVASQINHTINLDQQRATNMQIPNNTSIVDSLTQATPSVLHNQTEVNESKSLTLPSCNDETSMKQSKSVTVPIHSSTSRIQPGLVVPGERKRVINLPDINEVRRTNQKLLCAEVAPIQSTSNMTPPPVVPIQQMNDNECNKNTLNNVEGNPTDSNINNITPYSDAQPKSCKTRGRPSTKKSHVDEPKKKWQSSHPVSIPWIDRSKIALKADDVLITTDTVDKMLRLFAGEPFPKRRSHHRYAEYSDKADKNAKRRRRRNNLLNTKAYDMCCWARKKMELRSGINADSHFCPKNACVCCCKYLLAKKPKTLKKLNNKNVPVLDIKHDSIILSDDEEKKTKLEEQKTLLVEEKKTRRKREKKETKPDKQNNTKLKLSMKQTAADEAKKTQHDLENKHTVPNEVYKESEIASPDMSSKSDSAPASLGTSKQVSLDEENINAAMKITIASNVPHTYRSTRPANGPWRITDNNTQDLSRPARVKTTVKPGQNYSYSLDNVNTTISATSNVSTSTTGVNVAMLADSLRRTTVNPTEPTSPRPVFIERNKILLRTKTRMAQIQTPDVSSLTLPTGINFVVLPNKEIALSIDPGVELNQFQIQELQLIIKNIHAHLNSLTTVNNEVETSGEMAVESNIPMNSVQSYIQKENCDEVANATTLQNATEQSVDNPEVSNITQMDTIETDNSDQVPDNNSFKNNTDSLQTATENEEKNRESTSTTRKTILSDLMEMSGISEEDVQIPDVPNQIPVLTLDPVNAPFLRVDDDLQTPHIVASQFIRTQVALTALASRPDLQVVISYNDLKDAFENKSMFYKFDIITGVIVPVNVCIKKKVKSPEAKAPVVLDCVDLTAENEDGNNSTPMNEADNEELIKIKEINDDPETVKPVKLFRAVHPSILRHAGKGMTLIKKIEHRDGRPLKMKRVDANKILKLVTLHKRKQSFLKCNNSVNVGDLDEDENEECPDERIVSGKKRPLSKDDSESDEDEPLAKIVKRRNELAAHSANDIETPHDKENDISHDEAVRSHQVTLLEVPNTILMDDGTDPDSHIAATEPGSEEDCILGV